MPVRLAPGGGTNTLVLEGTGFFDLRQPTTLSNIQTVDVEGATPTQGHFIWLRNGLDLTLNMIDAAPAEIFGAVNNDIINLGSGAATVYVGSAGETVNGGSGQDTIVDTAARIGATLKGGSGKIVLDLQGGGAAVMGTISLPSPRCSWTTRRVGTSPPTPARGWCSSPAPGPT
jgi:hypothetical protein